MIPLLPFAAGLLAGGLAVRFLRDERARSGMKQTLESLGRAACDNLAAIGPARRTESPAPPAGAKKSAAKPAAARKKKASAARKPAAKGAAARA